LGGEWPSGPGKALTNDIVIISDVCDVGRITPWWNVTRE